MTNPIRFITARLHQWLFNRRPAPRHPVHLTAQIQQRLLLSISLPDAQKGTSQFLGPVKLIGSTRNISKSGLAVVVPSLHISHRLITDEECPLRIVLDIYPNGVVGMEAVTVRSERLDAKETDAGYLIGVKITEMEDSDRTRYLEYLESLAPKTT